MDPSKFTVSTLKEVCKRRELVGYGTKAEIIRRLQESDPKNDWLEEAVRIQTDGHYNHEGDDSEFHDSTSRHTPDPRSQSERNNEREMELLRRERDLMAKELELTRREMEILRQTPTHLTNQQPTRHININSLKDLLSDFEGTGAELRRWKEQFQLVLTTYGLDDDHGRLLMGAKLKGKALRWFHSKPEFIRMPLNDVLKKFSTMFDHQQDRLTLRKKFESRNWKSSESFSDYFHEKLILANSVPIDESEHIDYLIDGIPEATLHNQARIQCFKEKNNLLQAFEKITLKDDSKHVSENRKNSVTLNSNSEPETKDHKPNKKGIPTRCFNCSKLGHLATDCRQPVRPKGGCFKCFEVGHQWKDCPNKKPMQQEKHQVNNVEAERREYQSQRDGLVENPLDLEEHLVPAGSISPYTGNGYNGVNNSVIDFVGVTVACVTMNDVSHEIELLVVPNITMNSSVVLGRNALTKFNLGLRALPALEAGAIREIFNINVSEPNDTIALEINPNIDKKTQILLKKLFLTDYKNPERPESPNVKTQLCLRLTSDQVIYFGPRRMSFNEKEHLQKILDSLIAHKIIRVSDSIYAAPIVMVRKKNGEYRLCVDYRFLNKLILRDNYPLPLIEDQIDKLYNKRFFSLLDLRDGFHHIDVEPESVKYTSFITPLGQFEYLKMPFGLKTAPAKFQRFVNTVLDELIRSGEVVVYLDDILVASENLEEHFKILKKVFKILVDNKLELRLDKCTFLQTEIEYLGYKVTAEGLKPTDHGISAVVNFPIPRNIRDVQCFLGLCAYFRKFVEGFSIIAAPFYELLKKGIEFKFNDRALNCFEKLKTELTETPVLSIYDPRDETELHCDASKLGYGAVLLQRKKDGHFHPIFYFSKRTTEVESKYHSFELETLAIIYALKRFRIYLQGIKFKIVTDCNSLKLTLDKKEVNPRISRWALELENYDKTFEHRSGEKMQHVDAFSRAVNVIMIVEDNSLESNLSICQNLDPKIKELREKLQNSDDKFRPKTIVSDRGTCFTSSDFKNFIDENNVNHVLIATASPKANGQVERINRVLGPMLAKITEPLVGKQC
ncbi:uncharacterized protein LOC122508807, partial [Leptopilina heterotoma]|uniref:uncharacterized protein LOC122508807 n=1 Tax=Leptopilina heterotoma TaxID=63436 RepID=UPI001CA9DECE